MFSITTAVIAGLLSHATMQQAILEEYDAMTNALRDKWQLEAAIIEKWEYEAHLASVPIIVETPYVAPVAPNTPQIRTYVEPEPVSGDASAWANNPKSLSVKQCESGNNYSTNTGNGYYGAWQFDLPSWLANGGGAYAATPDQAPAWAQDQVAYNYYQSSGWGPWSCG